MKLSVRRFIVAVITTGLAVGCAARIPDMQPFAEHTARMSSGVKGGYGHVQTLLTQTELESRSITKLDTAWSQTSKTLTALVGYSTVLADLARTGTQGGEAANRVVGALEAVVTTLGFGAISGPVTDALADANRYIARVRARSALQDIIETAQPAIDTIAWIVRHNISELHDLNALAARDLKQANLTGNQALVNYYEGLTEADERVIRILTLFLEREAALLDRNDADASARLQELQDRDPMLTASNVEDRQRVWLARSRAIQGEAARYRAEYEAFQARQAEIDQLAASGADLLRAAESAVAAWSRAHRRLEQSLEQKWSFVNLVDFAVAVQDVYDAYKGG